MAVFKEYDSRWPRRSTLAFVAFAVAVVAFTAFALSWSGLSGFWNSANAEPASAPYLLAIPGSASPTPAQRSRNTLDEPAIDACDESRVVSGNHADPNVEAEGDVQPEGELEAESDSEAHAQVECNCEANADEATPKRDEEAQACCARDYSSESAADSRAADSPRTAERRSGCAAESATEEHTDTDSTDRQSDRGCRDAEPQPLAVRSALGWAVPVEPATGKWRRWDYLHLFHLFAD